MRVNVTYSVELEDVPKATAKLVRETKENSLSPLIKKLEEVLTLLGREDEKNAVRQLDEIRQELSKIDFRLADCMQILSGYQNVLLGNLEGLVEQEEGHEEAEQEAEEVVDEEG